MTTAERLSRWSGRFVVAGACWLAIWQVALLAGVSHRTGVVVGLLGFVFQTVFGKAYSLLPSYFDRSLATTRHLPVQFALASAAPAALAVGIELSVPALRVAGAVSWLLAVCLFVGTLAVTIRDNPLGSETGTGDASAHREQLDRTANRFVPVVLGYLLVGSYALLAVETDLPALIDGYPPRSSHLLGAGAGVLLVFTVGFRLLPRFFVTTIDRRVAAVVLTAGAVGPALLAVSLPAGQLFVVAACVQATAVVGYAGAVTVLFARSDRRRVGLYGVVVGAGLGVVAVGIGLLFAIDGVTAEKVAAHVRLTLLGLLGVTIVGITYQFYPPGVSDVAGVSDRTAVAVIGGLGIGTLAAATGFLTGRAALRIGATSVTAAAAVAHLFIVAAVVANR